MAFANNSYATVWSVEDGKGKFMKVRLSTSRKDKEGNYSTDFSGTCTFFGAASAKAQHLKERDRIKLGNVTVTNSYDKDKNTTYVNYNVFDFEMADGGTPASESTGGGVQSVAFKDLASMDMSSDDSPF